MIDHAELRAIEQLDRSAAARGRAVLQAHDRHDPRVDDPADMGKLINLGIARHLRRRPDRRACRCTRMRRGRRRVRLHQGAQRRRPAHDPLDRLPHHRAEAGCRSRPIAAHLAARAASATSATSIDQTMHVSGYTLVEATATAQLSKQYLAVLRCRRSARRPAETRAGYHSAGRVVMLDPAGVLVAGPLFTRQRR